MFFSSATTISQRFAARERTIGTGKGLDGNPSCSHVKTITSMKNVVTQKNEKPRPGLLLHLCIFQFSIFLCSSLRSLWPRRCCIVKRMIDYRQKKVDTDNTVLNETSVKKYYAKMFSPLLFFREAARKFAAMHFSLLESFLPLTAGKLTYYSWMCTAQKLMTHCIVNTKKSLPEEHDRHPGGPPWQDTVLA